MTITLTDEQVERGPRHSQLRRYFWTARERYDIYTRRKLGYPRETWTKDPIFQHCKFCNVFREHDKVTVWLRENWREPYADHPNLPFAMALARLINWPPTLERIGFPKRWSPQRVEDILYERKALEEKVYTGAYLLGAVPQGVPRQVYLVHDVLTPLHKDLRSTHWASNTAWPLKGSNCDDLESAWNWFRQHRGIGDFLAYEIVSDLRHTKYLCNAPFINTWANAGPGALRGLTRLWGYQPKTQHISGYSFPKKYALWAMLMLHKKAKLKKYSGDMPRWEMREVEHWLCEFDKYERIRHHQGVLEKFKPKLPGEW